MRVKSKFGFGYTYAYRLRATEVDLSKALDYIVVQFHTNDGHLCIGPKPEKLKGRTPRNYLNGGRLGGALGEQIRLRWFVLSPAYLPMAQQKPEVSKHREERLSSWMYVRPVFPPHAALHFVGFAQVLFTLPFSVRPVVGAVVPRSFLGPPHESPQSDYRQTPRRRLNGWVR